MPAALWTPGYWSFAGSRYRFHHGWWGRYVGFYGGINYGFGYTGSGFHGGYWNGNNFFYNQAVTRVNVVNIHTVYNRTVVMNNNLRYNRVSYNGGNGGIPARPSASDFAALRQPRTPPMTTQIRAREEAAGNRQQFFSANRGRSMMGASPLVYAADRGLFAAPRLAQTTQGLAPTTQGGFGQARVPAQGSDPGPRSWRPPRPASSGF